jgi:hypothetical protein
LQPPSATRTASRRSTLPTFRPCRTRSIIATLVGGSLLGILGALVAIPVAATIHLLLEEVAFRRLDQS